MKKILLLLILSFFSAQSFAGSCPDGSEPVKSVSDDGTYFVFNCGGGNSSNTNDDDNKSENSTIGQSIYKTITQGDAEIYEVQMLLNRFRSYSPFLSPNGQWTWETQSAVQKFYQALGKSFNGQWNSQILSDLKDRRLITMPPSGPLSFAEKSEILDEIELNYAWFEVTEVEKTWYKLHQPKFDIVTSEEVAPPFCYPTPEDCNDGGGVYSPDAHNAAVGDFNGDGLQDLAITWVYFVHTTERNTTPSHVRFYINDGNNNLISSPEIYALGELPMRHMLYRTIVDDFNNDGRDDLFVGSMGVIKRVKGQKRSLVDTEPNLLLLSTKDGKMKDSSHLIEGQENGGMIKDYGFSHATSSGDVNCDGFSDIYTGNILLVGDGTGRFLNKSRDLPSGNHSHQKANAFASSIADFNGDGCGDIVMHLQGKTISIWMSHNGKHLPRTFKELSMEDYYGKGNMKVNYMSSGDLDGDGDPDLVAAITRANPYYLGRKLLIFINEGGELIEKTRSLIQDVRDQEVNGRPQNHGEGSIQLIDHDRDGDLDIIDSTGGSFEANGRFGYAIFENDGSGHFTEIPESEFVILREKMFNGFKVNTPSISGAYPVDIDGTGRLDYVTFIRSSS
ncbi:VCBS repeat-containing protein, partial [Candidatus Thioglobus sp.]|nr:VCBS repeat-containing protein [Candidatus Thioglobus sp.]